MQAARLQPPPTAQLITECRFEITSTAAHIIQNFKLNRFQFSPDYGLTPNFRIFMFSNFCFYYFSSRNRHHAAAARARFDLTPNKHFHVFSISLHTTVIYSYECANEHDCGTRCSDCMRPPSSAQRASSRTTGTRSLSPAACPFDRRLLVGRSRAIIITILLSPLHGCAGDGAVERRGCNLVPRLVRWHLDMILIMRLNESDGLDFDKTTTVAPGSSRRSR
jgi:hypothetical protein